jgi:hypothetical protein
LATPELELFLGGSLAVPQMSPTAVLQPAV